MESKRSQLVKLLIIDIVIFLIISAACGEDFKDIPPYIFYPVLLIGLAIGDLIYLKVVRPLLKKGDDLIGKWFDSIK
jgi:hypothetical protein